MRARRVTIAVLAALVLATIGICQVEATTLTHKNGDMYIGFGLPVVWAFVIAGLIALRRRPGNRTGWLMIGIGFGWLCSALTDGRSDVVFTLGMLLSNIWPGLMVHLLLSYPSGTLDRRSRIIVAAGYAITLGVGLLLVPFSQPRTDGLGASPRSAKNLLLVSHQTTLINVMQVIAFAIAIAVLAAALVVLGQRWRAATPAMRRVLAPMYLTGATAIGVTLLVVAILQIAHVVGNMLSFYVFCISFTAIPVGYLFGILRTRLDSGSAVQTLVTTLRDQRTPGGLEDALRVALSDPTLEVAYRRAGTDEYVDADGAHVDLEPARGRATTEIEHDGEVVAVLVHAPVPPEETGLIDAVCGPAAMAIENERLQAGLRAQIQEVTASARRLRDVLENVHLLAVSLDLDGRITFANQHLADVTGWSRDELVGRTWLEMFPTGDQDYLARVRAERILVHDEMPLRTRSGVERSISWSNTLDRDAAGRVIGSTSIGEDVTDRNRGVRQEEALRRLATMVAGAARPDEIFAAVCEEVARLLGGQTGNLVRFGNGPGTGTVVAGWAEESDIPMPIGAEIAFDGPTAIAEAVRTGRPARVDDYARVDGDLAERLRGLGVRSSVAAPVAADGRLWGAIIVSTTGDATLARDAEARIGQFAEVVALCLSSTEARAQLAASRARIVAAGDAERRRLERNLHDGAQQRLVALSLALRMARATVAADHPAAELLDSAGDELMQALEELRELARGIHPAVLSDQGLRAALGALTGRSPVPVRLDVELGSELPPPVEAAAYYVVAESLTNIAKYAEAAVVEIVVRSDAQGARVEVRDDGVGGADPATGTGLRGLADRVDALGGVLQVTSPAGAGTTVTAEVPLETAGPEPAVALGVGEPAG
ncbi:MAG TPA: PAS domain S-box protein [Gaiellales bacterium]|nr:PAS domain S-box protein [Gaiellales bacterium]